METYEYKSGTWYVQQLNELGKEGWYPYNITILSHTASNTPYVYSGLLMRKRTHKEAP